MSAAAKSGALDVVQYLQSLGIQDGYGVSSAVQHGHMHILQLLYRRGCAGEDRLCIEAAKRSDLIMLQWLREQGCPWGCTAGCFEEVAVHAAQSHSMETMLWLHQQGNVLTERVMSLAASYGADTIVKWLQQAA